MTREERKQIKYKIALTNNPKQARELAQLLKPKTYQQHKAEARAKAQEWQQDTSPKSWGEIAAKVAEFEKLAKRWGLVQEFKREGII